MGGGGFERINVPMSATSSENSRQNHATLMPVWAQHPQACSRLPWPDGCLSFLGQRRKRKRRGTQGNLVLLGLVFCCSNRLPPPLFSPPLPNPTSPHPTPLHPIMCRGCDYDFYRALFCHKGERGTERLLARGLAGWEGYGVDDGSRHSSGATIV